MAQKTARATVTAKTTKTVEGQGKPGTHAAMAKATGVATRPKVMAATLEPRTARNAEPPKAVATPGALVVIVYDVAAAIKTLHRADGTVEEEAFDPATLPAIKAAEPGRTQIRIVNEANPVSTGSTGMAQPQPAAAIKAGPR